MSTRANRCENRDYYGYSSQGNRTGHDIYSGTGILPAYLDGDQQPIGSFEQMKSGQGMTQDMTQMIGSIDLAKESGGAGEGANGNPDVPGNGNATFFQNNGRKGFYAGGQWNDTGFHTMPAQLPGTGSTKAPASAPNTVEDQATLADKRLSGMWGERKFWGPKPGKQTGSRQFDDYRELYQPLPAYLPNGGITGPTGFGPGGKWGDVIPLPQPLPAYPAGPSPMVPNGNVDTQGGCSGNTDPYYNPNDPDRTKDTQYKDHYAYRAKDNELGYMTDPVTDYNEFYSKQNFVTQFALDYMVDGVFLDPWTPCGEIYAFGKLGKNLAKLGTKLDGPIVKALGKLERLVVDAAESKLDPVKKVINPGTAAYLSNRAARAIDELLPGLQNKTRKEIDEILTRYGYTKTGSKDGKFVQYYNKEGKVRFRVDGPHKSQKGVDYDHLHIIDENGNPIDEDMIVGNVDDEGVHHRIAEDEVDGSVDGVVEEVVEEQAEDVGASKPTNPKGEMKSASEVSYDDPVDSH